MQLRLLTGLCFLCVLSAQVSAQSYLGVKGGFEGPDIVVDNNNIYTTVGQPGKWAKANVSQSIGLQSSVVRSGQNALIANNSSTTGRRVYTPTFSPTPGQRLVVQYYRRVPSTGNSQESQAEISRNGSTSLTSSQGTYSSPASANTWEKVTFSPTSTDYAATVWAAMLHRKVGTGDNIYIDDVAVYTADAVDNTAPNSPELPVIAAGINNPATDLRISWSAPAGGLDGGGFMVVRYDVSPNADNDPNVNGIYAQGNTLNNGTGGLAGTVVYIGTETAIISSGLAYGTTYYYKIYAFDKAYNYSNEVSVSATTSGKIYYSKASGMLNDVATWGVNADGSGANPPNFTNDYLQFIIKNRTTATLASDWLVSGQGSSAIVGDGLAATEFIIPGSAVFSGMVSVMDNATLTNQGNTILVFETLSPTSTVKYTYTGSDEQLISTATYGNLVLGGSGIKKPASDFTIRGNLTVNGTAILDAPGFIFNLGGNWLVDAGASYDEGGNSRSAVIFTGKTTHQLNSVGGEVFGNLKVQDSGTVVMNSNVAVDSSLTLTSGHLSIGSNTLTLNGAFRGTRANSLTGSKTSNIIAGPNFYEGPLYFDSTTATSNYLNSLTCNSMTDTVVLGNRLYIAPSTVINSASTGFVKVMQGVLDTRDWLVLTSDATGTARIGQGDELGSYITGAVTTQYYAEARKSWRLLSSSLRDYDVTINQAWQEGNTFPDSTVAGEVPGFGTYITGGTNNYPDATSAQEAGYDFPATAGANPSLRIWENSNWNNGVPDGTIATALKSYQAYLVYMRGDRTIDLNNVNAAPNNTILRATGPIAAGNQPEADLSDPIAIVGNPFPSPIDFEKIYAAGAPIENRFWKWDHTLNTSGSFSLVQRNGANNYYSVPYNFSTPAINLQHIAPGEAFFAKATVPGTTLAVNETDKSDSVNTNQFSATAQMIFASLYKSGSADTLADGVAGLFSPESVLGIDDADAAKPVNMLENFYLRRSGQSLMIEGHPIISGTDTLFLGISQMRTGSFKVKVATQSFINSGVAAFFEDKYTSSKIPVALDGSVFTYSFSTGADAASKAVDRFMITFAGNQLLPLNFTNVAAYPKNREIAVDWKVGSELGIKTYEIERSANGTNFSKAGQANAVGASQYTWLDVNPLAGYNYYRIKSIAATGDVKYSVIVRASLTTTGKTAINIYPNPVTGNLATLQLALESGSYTATIYNNIGQKLSSTSIIHQGGTGSRVLDLTGMSAGMYYVVVAGDNGFRTTVQLNKN